ncbi:MAG: HEPN domain-containing protein [Candidatus Poribacteria bacterium]|nr:HEPN domain-containing protein [Candidatus Poribacteria bacterium]MDE0505060.1 HEPN domain-containing protein [Candidatus Poribacteria bacterium]
MNLLTQEWVEKAEKDYASAQWLQRAPMPVHDAICFHFQQCVEKYLKAWLQEANTLFPRTHDLEQLLDLIVNTIPEWNVWRPDFVTLTTHAVDFRYHGKSATADDAYHAMWICENVRQAIRESLAIPS